ncbi:uncharacterized protein LOC143809876 [Ranitomeya variabilis]|uniref:uncharacterized protein LOC143809876 n=1 Tax=Ranitomeya variabilis TaxID=490064 RepID=UPI004056C2F0
MDIVKLMDLSFLTSKEQAIIQEVLKRDAKLKKREAQRIRKLRRKTLDNKSMKLQTGEWFEALKAKRFLEYPNATDLLQSVLHQEAKSGFVQSRTSCLTKIKSLKFLKMFADSKSTGDIEKQCSKDEKNFSIKEECASPEGSEEQLSVTQILKDLELILDLEITPSIMDTSSDKNCSDSTTSASTSQPGLMNLEIFQTSLSPIKNAILGSGKGTSAKEYNYPKDGGIEDVHLPHWKIYQHKENASVPPSSDVLGETFCSSPS